MINVIQAHGRIRTCLAGDRNHDASIDVNEIVIAVADALHGCPAE